MFPISQCETLRQADNPTQPQTYRMTSCTHLKHDRVTEEKRKKQHWKAQRFIPEYELNINSFMIAQVMTKCMN